MASKPQGLPANFYSSAETRSLAPDTPPNNATRIRAKRKKLLTETPPRLCFQIALDRDGMRGPITIPYSRRWFVLPSHNNRDRSSRSFRFSHPSVYPLRRRQSVDRFPLQSFFR